MSTNKNLNKNLNSNTTKNNNIEHIATLMENRNKLAVAIKKDVEYIVKEETINCMKSDFDKKLKIMQDYIKLTYNK